MNPTNEKERKAIQKMAMNETEKILREMASDKEMANDSPTIELFAQARAVLEERWNDEGNHVEGCLGDLFSSLLAEVIVVEEEWEKYGHVMGDYSSSGGRIFDIGERKAFRVGLIEGQMKALRIMSHMIGTEVARAIRVEILKQLAADPKTALRRLLDDDLPGVTVIPVGLDELREQFASARDRFTAATTKHPS